MGYVGEIRIHAGNLVPGGWMVCDGQLLSTAAYPQLFGVIGDRFGGNGTTTFALPDLRGRTPIEAGQGPGLTDRVFGEVGGEEAVTLDLSQLPSHTHTTRASNNHGYADSPAGRVMARAPSAIPQFGATADVDLAAGSVGAAGGGQGHNNLQPFLTLTYVIAVQGVAP